MADASEIGARLEAAANRADIHAHNTEILWRGKPGWDENCNMAQEWRSYGAKLREAAKAIASRDKLLKESRGMLGWFVDRSAKFDGPKDFAAELKRILGCARDLAARIAALTQREGED